MEYLNIVALIYFNFVVICSGYGTWIEVKSFKNDFDSVLCEFVARTLFGILMPLCIPINLITKKYIAIHLTFGETEIMVKFGTPDNKNNIFTSMSYGYRLQSKKEL